MKIAYFAGGYIGNIGNAFIELGCIEALKKCLNEKDELYILNPGDSYEHFYNHGGKNFFDDLYSIEADIAILTGMRGDLRKSKPVATFFKYNPLCKLILFGSGVADGTGSETISQLKIHYEFLKSLNCRHIITRDVLTYDFLKDKVENIYRGIDMASFLHLIPIPRLSGRKYRIISDEKLVAKPMHLGRLYQFADAIHNAFKKDVVENLPKVTPNPQTDIILQHAQVTDPKNVNYTSTSPQEYLYLFGNAEYVHTNRIHAVIPPLVFGVPVKFYAKRKNNRYSVLDEFPIIKDKNEFMVLNMDKLKEKQKEQLEVMKKYIHE